MAPTTPPRRAPRALDAPLDPLPHPACRPAPLSSAVTGLAVLGLCAPVLSAQDAGSVVSELEVSDGLGGFEAPLSAGEFFGASVASLGDLDGDGNPDLAVAAPSGLFDVGRLFVVFLDAEGRVRDEVAIAPGVGGFDGQPRPGDGFAAHVAALGDLDGDGRPELAVGAPLAQGGGDLWILTLEPDGTVGAQRRIGAASSGLAQPPSDQAHFGASAVRLGDVDGDGTIEVAVGAPLDRNGSPTTARGALWILSFDAAGALVGDLRIDGSTAGLGFGLEPGELFGGALAHLDGLGAANESVLAVGAAGNSTVAFQTGAVYLLTFDAALGLERTARITGGESGFEGALATNDAFGVALAWLDDLDNDGVGELFVGAPGTDRASGEEGAVWGLLLRADGTVRASLRITEGEGGLQTGLGPGETFGGALAPVADRGGDGLPDLAVGALGAAPAGVSTGSLYLLGLDGVRAASIEAYGSGVNPPGSLTALRGLPVPGSRFVLGIDNPLGTQAAGSGTVLALNAAPDAHFPAGTSLPGFGMAGGGAPGELLVDVAAGTWVDVRAGRPWRGVGSPSPFVLRVPDDAALLGLAVFAQGAIVDSDPLASNRFGLTEGLVMVIGPAPAE